MPATPAPPESPRSTAARGPLLVIAGVTASGKTQASLALAELLQGEIVSADSVQVYRSFDIGSAKPTAEERRGIPHHLLDVLEPEEAWDAAHFAAHADDAIHGILERGRLPIVVGGTGLWLRALVRGLVDAPRPDPAVRARLEAAAEREGAPALHQRLAAVDPDAAAKVHPNDALRIVRALEVYEQTGTPLGALRRAHALGAPRYDALFVVLDSPDDLAERIEARFDAMLERGFVDEVRALLARHDPRSRAFGSVGYRQVKAHLEGALTEDAMRTEAIRATRIYARRQRTWFRSEPGVDWRTTAGDLLSPEGIARVRAWVNARKAGATP